MLLGVSTRLRSTSKSHLLALHHLLSLKIFRLIYHMWQCLVHIDSAIFTLDVAG